MVCLRDAFIGKIRGAEYHLHRYY